MKKPQLTLSTDVSKGGKLPVGKAGAPISAPIIQQKRQGSLDVLNRPIRFNTNSRI